MIYNAHIVSGLTENGRRVLSGSFKKCVCSLNGYNYLLA